MSEMKATRVPRKTARVALPSLRFNTATKTKAIRSSYQYLYKALTASRSTTSEARLLREYKETMILN